MRVRRTKARGCAVQAYRRALVRAGTLAVRKPSDMTDRSAAPKQGLALGTLTALSGVAFVALLLLAPEPSGLGENASAEAVAQFYAANQQAYRTALIFTGVAYLFFLVFQAALGSQLRRSEGPDAPLARIAMAAAVLLATFQVAGVALWAALGLVDTTGRDAAEVASFAAWGSLSQEALVVTATFWRVLLLGAVALAVLRHRALAGWFGWLTAGLAIVSLVAPLGLAVTAKTGLIAALGFGSHFAFYLWVVIASLVLAIRVRRAARLPAAAADREPTSG